MTAGGLCPGRLDATSALSDHWWLAAGVQAGLTTDGDDAGAAEGLWAGPVRARPWLGDEGARAGALGLSTAPVRGPAVHLCVAAGPSERRRPPQVRQRAHQQWRPSTLLGVGGR